MPVISMFYGIIISMYFFDNMKHNLAHVHAKYQDDEAVICIRDGSVLDGKLPNNKLRLVQAWVEIHREDLLADWQLAIDGQQIFKIAPLK